MMSEHDGIPEVPRLSTEANHTLNTIVEKFSLEVSYKEGSKGFKSFTVFLAVCNLL
jgi:hypothetical protein